MFKPQEIKYYYGDFVKREGRDRVSGHSSGWPQTCNDPASASKVLGSQESATYIWLILNPSVSKEIYLTSPPPKSEIVEAITQRKTLFKVSQKGTL